MNIYKEFLLNSGPLKLPKYHGNWSPSIMPHHLTVNDNIARNVADLIRLLIPSIPNCGKHFTKHQFNYVLFLKKYSSSVTHSLDCINSRLRKVIPIS